VVRVPRWVTLSLGLLLSVGLAVLVNLATSPDNPPGLFGNSWFLWTLFGLVLVLLVAVQVSSMRDEPASTFRPAGPSSSREALGHDQLVRAAKALDELRQAVPLLQAELVAQERAVADLAAKTDQHQRDADRNAARARLYETAANELRELVAETSRAETDQLRRDLRRLERKNRRDQVVFLIIGAAIGAATNLLTVLF
jgi:FtsH-binding integral membrane protein